MLLHLTGNDRFCVLSEGILWAMEQVPSDSVEQKWKIIRFIVDAPLSSIKEGTDYVTWYVTSLECYYIGLVMTDSVSFLKGCCGRWNRSHQIQWSKNGNYQVRSRCTIELYEGGDRLCNLVCHITGMLLHLTSNDRFCILSEGMLWMME